MDADQPSMQMPLLIRHSEITSSHIRAGMPVFTKSIGFWAQNRAQVRVFHIVLVLDNLYF